MNTCQNGYSNSRMQGHYAGMGMPSSMGRESACPCNSARTASCMEDGLSDFEIAMAYVPWQEWENLYDLDKALQTGTIFCDLDKPFLGRRCGR